MKDLLDKLSSYNLFNYLLPGVLFAVLVKALTSQDLIQKDLVSGVFVYYFLGSIVSRLGSLVVEPVLRRSGFVKFASYAAFVQASKSDSKIEVLSEANNMYRTFVALIVMVSVVVSYDVAAQSFSILRRAAPAICLFSVGLVFVVSYRKQTAYINRRVAANQK